MEISTNSGKLAIVTVVKDGSLPIKRAIFNEVIEVDNELISNGLE